MIYNENQLIDIVSANEDRHMSANRIDLATKTVYIYDEIDEYLSEEFSIALPYFDCGEVTIKINSMGGNFYDTQAIIAEMLQYKKKLTFIIDIVNIAFSGAAMVALCGDKIKMSKLGLFMLHYPSAKKTDDISMGDDLKDITITKEHFERTMTEILKETKLTLDQFRKESLTKGQNLVYTPKECKKLGFIDTIY